MKKGGICCTRTIGTGRSPGRAGKSSAKALGPPVETPIARISNFWLRDALATERTGRRAYALEIDPVYVETAIRRWEDYTGDHAVHAETGLTLEEVKAHRAQATRPQEPNALGSPVLAGRGGPEHG